jgi:predicted transcriptional regulator
MANPTRLNLEIDPKVKAALRVKAKAARVTISVVVRWAIDAYLAAESKEGRGVAC